MKEIAKLIKRWEMLSKLIIKSTEKHYPKGKIVLFKVGNMKNYASGEIVLIHSAWWGTPIPELRIRNLNTNKKSWISYDNLHPDDQL